MIASFHSFRRTILFGLAGAMLMAILLPGLALLRDSNGHDWYAAGKLFVTEAMIAVGFDPTPLTEYRAADGSIRMVTRFRLAHTVEARMARSHLLSTFTDNALLGAGAGAGFGGAVLLAILSNVTRGGWHEWMSRAVVEPMPQERGFPSHRCLGIVKVRSYAESGERVALLPAAETDRNSTKNTSTRRVPDATSAGRITDVDSPEPAHRPTPNSRDIRESPEKSAETYERASDRDGDGVAGSDRERPSPDCDGDWF